MLIMALFPTVKGMVQVWKAFTSQVNGEKRGSGINAEFRILPAPDLPIQVSAVILPYAANNTCIQCPFTPCCHENAA